MNLQPRLDDDLVSIRPLTNQDLEPLYEVAKDPKIWEQHPNKRYLREEFEKFFAESIQSKGALAIVDKKSEEIIGSSRFKTINGFSNGLEIGWTFLGRNYWGGPYNNAVKNLMIAHAFNFVDYVVLYIAYENIRSQKAAEKIGAMNVTKTDRSNVPSKGPGHVTYVIKKQT